MLDAAAAMEWVPGGAVELRTDDYRLIRYPDVVLDPTFRAAQVTWSRTERPLDEILEEIAAYARVWGVPGVAWWISAATQPADTEEALRAQDAELIDAAQILARELGDLPQLDVPDDVVVELVRDERTFRASSAVTVQGWGRTEPDEAELARQLAETLASLDRWSSFRVVALVDDVPCSTGGCTLADEVAQLWGAITLPASRGPRQLPGRARRAAPPGPRARRDPGPGQGPHPDLRPDPAPGRVRRLRRGALLLAPD